MDSSTPDIELCKKLLEAGKSILNLQMGIVSKVYGGNYELVAIEDVCDEFKVGDVLDLNATYCKDVVTTGKTIAITEIDGVHGLQQHPLYAARALEAYIGVPIVVNTGVWGTINFSSMTLRTDSFSSAEIALVEVYADLVADTLKH